MAEKPQSYYGTWINRQRSLLPGLDEELDPLTAKLEHLIIILDTLGLEAFVAPPSRGRGRPPDDRPAIARSFVAKAVLTIPHHIGPDRASADRSCTATHLRLGTPLRGSQRGNLLARLCRVRRTRSAGTCA